MRDREQGGTATASPSEREDSVIAAPAAHDGPPVTVLFTDAVGSTELQLARGDEHAKHAIDACERLIRERAAVHGGRIVKSLGDGHMVSFDSPRGAVLCAAAIQRDLQAGREAGQALRLRLGVHTGSALRSQDGDLHGGAISAAARICSAAAADEVLASEVVRRLCGTVPGIRFEDRGEFDLKGLSESWRLFRVVEEPRSGASDRAVAGQGTRVGLAGGLTLEIGGERRDGVVPGGQARAVLAYLLVNRDRPVARDELIDALWPGPAPGDPQAVLSTLLSRLRRALDGAEIKGRDPLTLSLPGPVAVDVEEALESVADSRRHAVAGDWRDAAQAARDALTVLDRKLLPEIDAEWLAERRRELEETRLEALETLAECELSESQRGGRGLAAARHAAKELIAASPYRESAYRLLMEIHERQGNVAQALQVYDDLRRLLRDEIGSAPSSDVQAVHQRLIAAGSEPPEAERLPLPPPLRPREGMPMFGRRDVLAELEACLSGIDSASRLAAIAGEPGIGKSRLAAELAQRAHGRGHVVLYGRARQEALIPYEPFVEALRHWVSETPSELLREQLSPWGGELRRLLPDLAWRVPDLPEPLGGDEAGQRWRLLEATSEVLCNVASASPLIVVLDDVHWADRPTMVLLRHLITASRGRMLAVVTYRDTDPSGAGPVRELVDELGRVGCATHVSLTGLSPTAVGELVEAHARHRAAGRLVEAIHAGSGGNPLFVQELVRSLAAAGEDGAGDWDDPAALRRLGAPSGVKETISRRVGELGGEVAETLSAAAVIGREFDVSLLEPLTGVESDLLIEQLEAAMRAGLIVEDAAQPERLAFSHALVREALYEGMSGPRRCRVHRRVSQVLEAQATARQDVLAPLSHHLFAAGADSDLAMAARYAAQAGQDAYERLAYETAGDLFARAAAANERSGGSEAERCEALISLGRARLMSGDSDAASRAFGEAARLAEDRGWPERLGRATLALSGGLSGFAPRGWGDPQKIDRLRETLAALGPEAGDLRAKLLAHLAVELHYADALDPEAEQVAGEAHALAGELGEPSAQLAALCALYYTRPVGKVRVRLDDAREIVRIAEGSEDPEMQFRGHAFTVGPLIALGAIDEADEAIAVCTRIAERLRHPSFSWEVAVFAATRAVIDGELDRGERLSSEALEIGTRSPNAEQAVNQFGAQFLSVRVAQGRLEEVEPMIREFGASFESITAWRVGVTYLFTELGKPDEARKWFDGLAASDFEDWAGETYLADLTILSFACRALEDAERARRLYEMALPHRELIAVDFGGVEMVMSSMEGTLGVLAATFGEVDVAIEHFERAHRRNHAGVNRWHAAATDLMYARSLIDRGSAGDIALARELAEGALESARRHGFARVESSACELLAGLPEAPAG